LHCPGSLAEVEKRFAEGYDYRKKYSELTRRHRADRRHAIVGVTLNRVMNV
jgi:hypothetical protein